MIVTVFVSSGLTNAYRSVLSARGSWLISGASEWLDALAVARPGQAGQDRGERQRSKCERGGHDDRFGNPW